MAKSGSKSMLKGLTRQNPSGTPSGGYKSGPSVGKDATRSGTAKTPATLGPRTA